MREKRFKRLNFRISIGQNWGSIDQKINSIDRAPIELGKFKPKFLMHFRSVEKYI